MKVHIRTTVEKISPQMAEAILAASKESVKNRHVRDSHVEWLAGQMKAGKWRLNGEAIILDEEGLLLDGQHRLWAVIMSGVTIETSVTRGVDRATFPTIDSGVSRNAADCLGISGEANSLVLASALGWLFKYEHGKMLFGHKGAGITSEAILKLSGRHPGLREDVSWAGSTARGNAVLCQIPKSPLAFLRYQFRSYKPNKGAEFFDLIGDIRADQPGTATRTLRDWLIADRRKKGTRASTMELMAIIVKAWTAFLDGEAPRKFQWRRGGEYPESFPTFPGDKESKGKVFRKAAAK